ncbi:MAG: DeoR/GlpR family DNA-binding transcription regulator [Paracoccaceae bacterium]|nr:DeoR/GlpR family DNA-binding transcription regulator [Paracoccaceae bacterium]
MKVKSRQDKIIALVRKHEQLTIEELSSSLASSKETIRRDVAELAKMGNVQKIHGGIMLPNTYADGSFRSRMSTQASAKSIIANTAINLFNQSETLFIVTGSTTLYFAEQLYKLSNLTIVTNSGEIAKASSNKPSSNRIFLLGGEYNTSNNQTIGTMVASQCRSFRAHHTILTIGALDEVSGAMQYSIDEAQIAAAMIDRSEKVTVLVDSSKFGKLASFEICPLSKIDRIICEELPRGSLKSALEHNGVEIILAT